MKNKWILPVSIIGGIVLVVVIFFSWANGVYNNAIVLQENVNRTWGDVLTNYQRRADLVPQLVATVKGAAANERGILTEVTQARAGIVNAKTPQDVELMGKKINTAINLAFEAYPQIRSTENFQELQAQLEGTENRIQVSRRDYNEAVMGYNTLIRGFFRKMAIGMMGSVGEFPRKEMFQAAAGAEKAPEVKF
jgi:LemA protein